MRKALLAIVLTASGCAHRALVEPPMAHMSRDGAYQWVKTMDGAYLILANGPVLPKDLAEVQKSCGICSMSYRGSVWTLTPLK